MILGKQNCLFLNASQVWNKMVRKNCLFSSKKVGHKMGREKLPIFWVKVRHETEWSEKHAYFSMKVRYKMVRKTCLFFNEILAQIKKKSGKIAYFWIKLCKMILVKKNCLFFNESQVQNGQKNMPIFEWDSSTKQNIQENCLFLNECLVWNKLV